MSRMSHAKAATLSWDGSMYVTERKHAMNDCIGILYAKVYASHALTAIMYFSVAQQNLGTNTRSENMCWKWCVLVDVNSDVCPT